MATLADAEHAREHKAEYLRKLGAHAVGVEPLKRPGKKKPRKPGRSEKEEFGVIAYFTELPKKPLPEALEVRSGKKLLRVPLKPRVASRFQLE